MARRLLAGFAVCVLASAGLLTGLVNAALAVDDTAVTSAKPPKLLSDFGFFEDAPQQVPASGVLPFAPASALFSDHARKLRFVYVPPGKQIAFEPDEAFRFPVGSALIKTFAFPANPHEPAGALRLVETRVLLRQESGWNAWAYVWRQDQSDAELNIVGAKVPMEIRTPQGELISFTYSVPNKNQCKGCHDVGGELTPIGPKARNLNHDHPYADGPHNQLANWAEMGILAGLPDLSEIDRVPDWRDETASLDARARAWLDINCAHCHRADGPASNSGLFLGWNENEPVKLGINKRPVAAGRGAGSNKFDIVPGSPSESILYTRMASTEPGVMMPELGRALADLEAMALISAWIESLR